MLHFRSVLYALYGLTISKFKENYFHYVSKIIIMSNLYVTYLLTIVKPNFSFIFNLAGKVTRLLGLLGITDLRSFLFKLWIVLSAVLITMIIFRVMPSTRFKNRVKNCLH